MKSGVVTVVCVKIIEALMKSKRVGYGLKFLTRHGVITTCAFESLPCLMTFDVISENHIKRVLLKL